ncbi:MAG: VOC family protein [Candidatus Brocadiae bacterium]|nr:VOC family protein [Candidatus Brocadiia bacterium]
MPMTPGHIELFVPSPSRAKDFYHEVLGFEIGEIQHDGKVVWMTKDGLTILLRPGTPPAAASYQETAIALVLYTDDLDREVAALQDRGLAFRGTDGSERCLTFSDPWGNWFQLVNPAEQGPAS